MELYLIGRLTLLKSHSELLLKIGTKYLTVWYKHFILVLTQFLQVENDKRLRMNLIEDISERVEIFMRRL